jgi:hypothetical protein
MNTEEINIDIKDALNEYFRLKNKFDNEITLNKKKIMNNPTLSKREKRSEFLKLKPKCINCKRPSKLGTIFSCIYHKPDETTDSFRTLKAMCGDRANPCNLDIEIELGSVNSIEEILNELSKDIQHYKNDIINDKNKLLFGLITTETAISNFDTNKDNISTTTSLYENYLDIWNQKTDNQEKKTQLNETLVNSYEYIRQIKNIIKKMRENNDTQYAVDAVNIYHTLLQPLLNKIRSLKYSENYVYNDDNDYCKLIQNKYNISDINISIFDDKVKIFNMGIDTKSTKKKKPLVIIESDDENVEETKKPEQGVKVIPRDEPIIGVGKDGIDWNIPEYKVLWSKIPEKLKSEFKLNIDWMKDFMYKCLNKPYNKFYYNEPCRLTTPPNLIIPPKLNETTKQYDFGVSIYSRVFNKLPKTGQDIYLTLYKTDPVSKAKDYTQLENAMNNLVEKEVEFDKVYIR